MTLIDADLDRLWDFNRPDSTETLFQGFLLELRAASTPDPSLMVALLTQIARAQGIQGKLNEAAVTLKEADALFDRDAEACRAEARVRLLLEKGRLNCLLRTPANAGPLLFEAWQLASQAKDDNRAIDIAQLIASIEPAKKQKEWTLKALALAEASQDQKVRLWLGALYTTLGSELFELRQYDKAMEFFKKALERLRLDLEAAPDDKVLLKRSLVARGAIAKTLRVQGQVNEAMKIQEELLAELQRGGLRSGDVFEELAECLTLLKRTSEAATYFESAYRELVQDQWIVDNMPDRMKRIKALGKVK